MREIILTRGMVTVVDDEDYEWLNQWKWQAHENKRGVYYAVRNAWIKETKGRERMAIHRMILGLSAGDPRKGDHINHDGLDNRRANLRIATHGQNVQNSRRRRDNTSGFKGVSWDKEASKWQAYIFSDKRRRLLGRFKTKEEAHAAYCVAAQALWGEFSHFG